MQAFDDGDSRTALHHFLQAMEYPANLGVGRPSRERLALPKYWAAKAHEALGHPDEAAALYREAVSEQHRRVSPIQYYQGLAFQALGQVAEADSLFRDMIQASRGTRGGSRYAALLAGLGYHGLGETDRARELLETSFDDSESSNDRSSRYIRRYRNMVRQILSR